MKFVDGFRWPRLALMIVAPVALTATAVQKPIPPAFGPYIHPSSQELSQAKSFRSSDRIVGTYYFYWYSIESGEHITNPENGSDGLTDHPPTLKDFSYRSIAWHKKQLSDMTEAGIDLALMVFWGAPSEHATNTALHWSYAGLPPLVQARDQLVKEGKHPPRIGLFYDTSTLQYNAWHEHIDLTTDYGKRWFYATIRDFYSMIPTRDWAMIDGKPIVLLYASAFAKAHDQSFVDFAKAEFKKDFGREPYIAPQDSWHAKGDNVCAWGGAFGLKNPGIGELGPGYDHSAVYGRTPLVQKRDAGKFYEMNWTSFLRKPSNFVMIETWSEFHEGTDICESKEYGRQYIELTRKYSDLFKSHWQPQWPKGPFTGEKTLSMSPEEQGRGLRVVEPDDGKAQVEDGTNGRFWLVSETVPSSRYLYFKIDDSYKWAERMDATVSVDYQDRSAGKMLAEYDGEDFSAPFNGAYTRAEAVELKGDKSWKTAQFRLSKAHFLNGENSGADFRIVAQAPDIAIRSVKIERLK